MVGGDLVAERNGDANAAATEKDQRAEPRAAQRRRADSRNEEGLDREAVRGGNGERPERDLDRQGGRAR